HGVRRLHVPVQLHGPAGDVTAVGHGQLRAADRRAARRAATRRIRDPRTRRAARAGAPVERPAAYVYLDVTRCNPSWHHPALLDARRFALRVEWQGRQERRLPARVSDGLET